MKTIWALALELKRMEVPKRFPDGSCIECWKGARLCKYHQVSGQIDYLKRADVVAKASENFRLGKAERERYNGGCDLNHNEDHVMERK